MNDEKLAGPGQKATIPSLAARKNFTCAFKSISFYW